jgi:hypothetical protein
MNNQNLLLDKLDEAEYNIYLKPFIYDIGLLAEKHPHIVLDLVDSAKTPESLCDYLQKLLLDTRGNTRGGFHPNTAYFLLTLYTNYRPTPLILDNE